MLNAPSNSNVWQSKEMSVEVHQRFGQFTFQLTNVLIFYSSLTKDMSMWLKLFISDRCLICIEQTSVAAPSVCPSLYTLENNEIGSLVLLQSEALGHVFQVVYHAMIWLLIYVRERGNFIWLSYRMWWKTFLRVVFFDLYWAHWIAAIGTAVAKIQAI